MIWTLYLPGMKFIENWVQERCCILLCMIFKLENWNFCTRNIVVLFHIRLNHDSDHHFSLVHHVERCWQNILKIPHYNNTCFWSFVLELCYEDEQKNFRWSYDNIKIYKLPWLFVTNEIDIDNVVSILKGSMLDICQVKFYFQLCYISNRSMEIDLNILFSIKKVG